MSAQVEFLAMEQSEWLALGTDPATFAGERKLLKLGFANLGEVVDPEDGPVWRWARGPGTPPS